MVLNSRKTRPLLVAFSAIAALTTGCRGAHVRSDANAGALAGSAPIAVPSADSTGGRIHDAVLVSARADEPPAPVPVPPPMPMPMPTPAPMPAPTPGPVPAAGDEAKNLLDETARRAAIDKEKADYLVAVKLEEARNLVALGDNEGAARVLIEARSLAPTNAEVLRLLSSVQESLAQRGPAAAGTLEELLRQQKIRIDEQRTSAQNFFSLGRSAQQKGDYDRAIENFQSALNIITSSPYEIDWRTLKQDAQNGLAASEKGRKDAEKAVRRSDNERALGDLADDEEKRLLEEQARLETIMISAIMAFGRDEYELAENQADIVLESQPDNRKAKDLKNAATSARHEKVAREQTRKDQLAMKEWALDMQGSRNLEHKILRWPSQKFWNDITHARAARQSAFGGAKQSPEEIALAAKLRTTTVNLSVEGRPFKEVLQTLQIQSGVNILLDARSPEVGDAQVQPTSVEQVSLKQALDMLMAMTEGLVWTIQGNVVVFMKKELVKHNLTLNVHGVADLTAGLTEFKPPKIDLVPADQVNDEENPLFGSEGEETIKPYGSIDDIIELVKSAVGNTETWAVEGASINAQGTTGIVVKHTAEVQGQVEKFLNDLRAFAGIVVTIETRFLTVSDNFLRDVGVDIRGLGGQTPGSLVNLDDVTNGLEDKASAGRDNGGPGLPAGVALNPSAGAYFNDGRDGDFRGRNENIFERPLGTILSSLGGASFSLAYLDDSQLAAVIKAVEKNQSGRTLTAPTITVYNTQRANLTVVNQLSYIQDFDVEVAQTSFIADPIIGVIQDGLTLDVRPTVSNDRRFITLELQPTVAKLSEPIPTFSTTLGSSFTPVIIQLPELRLQRARTTVRLPDGGSIVIGGLKNISTVDRTSEIPFLAKIPLLSFLTSRKGRSDEQSNLMIIVRAKITDLQEEESRFRGR